MAIMQDALSAEENAKVNASRYGETLKMVFGLENGNTLTWDLKDPKNGLTRSEVDSTMSNIILKQAIVSGGFYAITANDAYILKTERIELT